jgi:DNA-binding CsgD family transcriptional regulator
LESIRHSSYLSEAVPRLSASDAERLLSFVAEAEHVADDQPFTSDLLVELGRLVEADWVTYCELDRVRKRNLLNVGRRGDPSEGSVEERVFWELVIEEHPVCVQHQRGVIDALKISDFMTLDELRRSRLYDEWFGPAEIQHELNVPIPSPLWHTKTFLFDRAGRRDFTERDRLVLDLLRPQLARIWQFARTRRLLRVTLAELGQASESDRRGVVVLSATGEVEFASPPAGRLLRDFFGANGGARLPAAVSRWLESGTQPLVRRRGAREVTVVRSGETLLLRERDVGPDLTAREREVLAWVARGKTNPEIAELLWLAPSTVRKHLENVYAKFGVNTRTAAVARFLGLLDAEAS